jgi:NhaP-type Na+/H+ and K+/H+ antiporter
VSFVARAGTLLQVSGDTVLRAGDDVALLAGEEQVPDLDLLFGAPGAHGLH